MQFKSKEELTTSCTEDLGFYVCEVNIRTKVTMQEMEKVHTWKSNNSPCIGSQGAIYIMTRDSYKSLSKLSLKNNQAPILGQNE